jgi:AcrR family transcriptional regulator
MTPQDRRQALVDATLPLLLEHGRGVTTKQIAEAAGVAEGTIFRVFESKDDLVTAAIERGLDLEPFLVEIAEIDPELDLRALLLEIVVRLRDRFQRMFSLMAAVGTIGPPRGRHEMSDGRARAESILVALVEPHADALTLPPRQVVHTVRLLTFAGTHPHISDGNVLAPSEIVSTVLDGVLKKKDS